MPRVYELKVRHPSVEAGEMYKAKPMKPESLLAWMESHGMSQRDASEALGCARNALAHWTSGEVKIPLYISLAAAAISYRTGRIESVFDARRAARGPQRL